MKLPKSRRSLPSALYSLTGWLFAGLSCLYVLGLAVYQLAFVSPWAESHTLYLIQALELLLYLPLPILALGLLFTKQRPLLLVLSYPIILFGLHYGQLFLPKASIAGPRLRVMTWNILFSNENMHGIVHAIEHERPDIIAIQELSKPQSFALSVALEAAYPYQLLRPGEGASGMGIFSRFPLSNELPEKMAGLHCRCQHVILAYNNHAIELINVHPHIPHIYTHSFRSVNIPIGLDSATQQDTFDALAKRIEQRSLPLLVLGDLNTTERQAPYSHLRASLHDAFREAGWGLGLTFPQNFQLKQIPIPAFMRLDYILFSQEWKAQKAWTDVVPGSDHGYVVADLVLNP